MLSAKHRLYVSVSNTHFKERWMSDDAQTDVSEVMKALGSEGGKARAENLTPEQRSEIARRGAEARWGTKGIKRATHSGSLRIGNIVIQCAVLEDGTRLITQRGFAAAMGGSKPSSMTRRGAGNLPAIMNAANLKPFISEDLEVTATPVEFQMDRGGRALGIKAIALPKMCKVWLKASKAGKLTKRQEKYAVNAEILYDGFGEIGIIALVDEATGYQEVRDRLALQEILDRYLQKEFAAWAKKFPDEFYKQIFRLRGWTWKGMKVNRPQCVANYTNDIVWSRLTPGILQELQSRNPVLENGRRKGLHTQLLTTDIGDPALAQHLYGVIGLMRTCDDRDWDSFLKLLNRAYEKKGASYPLFKDIED